MKAAYELVVWGCGMIWGQSPPDPKDLFEVEFQAFEGENYPLHREEERLSWSKRHEPTFFIKQSNIECKISDISDDAETLLPKK